MEGNFTFCIHLKPRYIKIRGFGLIELRQLFLETSRYQHATYKPQTQLQAPKTKIQLLIYKFSIAIGHLSPRCHTMNIPYHLEKHFFMLFVNLPDKSLSLSPSVLSESYEVDVMKSISAGVICNVDFFAL